MLNQVTIPKYYIGTSGWYYDHWREVFYPKGLVKSRWLEFYSNQFSTVELNNSFYHLPTKKAFINWRDSSPLGFLFSVKVSRFITHIRRLKDTTEPISKLIANARFLEGKLGPLLYQLPQNMRQDIQLLEDFIKILPKDVCHVFEFRHSSWFENGTFSLLNRYNVGFCIYDMPGCSTPILATSNFAYIRFHGSRILYGGSYSEKELEDWARLIMGLGVRTVYAYFNNDMEGYATKNALILKDYLKVES